MLPLWSDASHCWCVVDHWFYRLEYASGTLRKAFRIPRQGFGIVGYLKDVIARSWLRRKFRPGTPISTMVGLANGDLVVIFDRVYWYSPGVHKTRAEVIPSDIHPPMATPLRGGAVVHAGSQKIYYGEYLNGHDREIRVSRIDVATRQIDSCWSFSRREIKHIHAIHYDRFRNRLWICTGDQDHESAFYYTDDEFESVHRFAGGDQSWRAIALLFDETGMEWGMDAGKDAPADAINRIYRYEFASGLRTELAIIGNPAYAACEFTDGTAVMQTTFEPGRQQDTPEESTLWFRDRNRQWTPCFRARYAPRPRDNAGQYGSILLPSGIAPKGILPFTPINCSEGSYRMHHINWNIA